VLDEAAGARHLPSGADAVFGNDVSAHVKAVEKVEYRRGVTRRSGAPAGQGFDSGWMMYW
jgi:hypothetical protein